jgi:hypothetical protein
MSPLVSAYLHRNGVIIERARREGRSLSYIERNIIMAGRDMAKQKGVNQHFINTYELEGEQDRSLVFDPIKVEAKFAYYFEIGEPQADYVVIKSNHPSLVVGGNVSAETLEKNGIRIPTTPSFEKWVKDGRKCFRGESV